MERIQVQRHCDGVVFSGALRSDLGKCERRSFCDLRALPNLGHIAVAFRVVEGIPSEVCGILALITCNQYHGCATQFFTQLSAITLVDVD